MTTNLGWRGNKNYNYSIKYRSVQVALMLLGPGMFVEGGLNTNYTVLSNLFGSFDFNRGTN